MFESAVAWAAGKAEPIAAFLARWEVQRVVAVIGAFAGAVPVVVGMVNYIAEGDDRALARYLQAWQVLSASGDKDGNHGQREAVQLLVNGGQSLQSRRFKGVDFTRLCLKRANFSYTAVIGSNFAHADLRYANFRNACLDGTRLQGADLHGADFTGACVFTDVNTGVPMRADEARGFKPDDEKCLKKLEGADVQQRCDFLREQHSFKDETERRYEAPGVWSSLKDGNLRAAADHAVVSLGRCNSD